MITLFVSLFFLFFGYPVYSKSVRHNGLSITEIVGIYMGHATNQFMRAFTVSLMIIVGMVFIMGPAEILAGFTPDVASITFWVWVVLLYYEADPNIFDAEDQYSSLMFAAAEGHFDVTRVLLQNKADPTIKDKDGETAESFARRNGHERVAELLSRYQE